MSALSDYLEAALLDHVFRNTSYTRPTAIYVGLHTDAPGEDTQANECDFAGYARQDAADGGTIDTGWTAVADAATGTGKQTTNAQVLTFPPNGDGADVTVTHVALYDGPTGGNMLFWAALDAPKLLETGDVLTFLAEDLVVSLD